MKIKIHSSLLLLWGGESPEAVKSKDGWFLMKNLKTTDKALLAAVLLGAANDDTMEPINVTRLNIKPIN